MIEIKCEPLNWDIHSDYCERDGAISDCIAEFGNSLTGGFYIGAAIFLTYWICKLQIPPRTFFIPCGLLLIGISTIIFHINLSTSWGFITSTCVYLFFTIVNIHLINFTESWKKIKIGGLFLCFILSILVDNLVYHSYGVHYIEGMCSFGHLFLTMFLVINHRRSEKMKKLPITRYYLARSFILLQGMLIVKLIESVVPCEIDTLGACRWIWHLFSAFSAYYGGLCTCIIVAENDFSFTSSDDIQTLITKAPHIPSSLRKAIKTKRDTNNAYQYDFNSIGDDNLEEVDSTEICSRQMGIEIYHNRNVHQHPDDGVLFSQEKEQSDQVFESKLLKDVKNEEKNIEKEDFLVAPTITEIAEQKQDNVLKDNNEVSHNEISMIPKQESEENDRMEINSNNTNEQEKNTIEINLNENKTINHVTEKSKDESLRRQNEHQKILHHQLPPLKPSSSKVKVNLGIPDEDMESVVTDIATEVDELEEFLINLMDDIHVTDPSNCTHNIINEI